MTDARLELTTERLALRPWRVEEAPLLLDIRGREDVARWLSDPAPWSDVATAREHIAGWEREPSPPLGVLAIVPHAVGQPVGTVKLDRVPGGDEVEVGWYLHPEHTGRGYAREAAAAMLSHAATSGIPRVWAIMWPHNDASARVCRAVGMRELGVVIDPWYGSSEDPDSLMFRWEPAPGG